MSGAQIRIVSDGATPRLAALLRTTQQRRPLLALAGKTAEVELKAWFRAANLYKPNRRGWKRSNFWARILGRTAYDPSKTTDRSAVVAITDPAIRPHVYGATIRPKKAKALAIPLRPEAYGVRPSSGVIAGLRFVPIGQTAKTVGYLQRREGAQMVSYYRLVRAVTIRRDPSALPPPDKTTRAIVRALERRIARQTRGGRA